MQSKEISGGRLIAAALEDLSDHRREVLRYLAVFVPLEFGSSLADILLGLRSALEPTELVSRLGFSNGPIGFAVLLASMYGQLYLFGRMLRGPAAPRPLFAAYLGFLGLGALSFIGVTISIMFFLLPGLFVGARLLMCPALFADKRGGVVGSLAGSWRMTRGHTRPVMLALLVVVIVYLAAGSGLDSLAKGFAALGPTMRAIGAALADSVSGEVLSMLLIGLSVASYRAIVRPESELAEVFA